MNKSRHSKDQDDPAHGLEKPGIPFLRVPRRNGRITVVKTNNNKPQGNQVNQVPNDPLDGNEISPEVVLGQLESAGPTPSVQIDILKTFQNPRCPQGVLVVDVITHGR